MSSAEHPKAVVLLLLIHCSVLPPLLFVCVRVCAFVCVCVWGGGGWGLRLVLQYLLSSFAIISLGKKDSWLLYFMSFDSLCSVSLSHGAVGWSTVCDCGIS